MDTTDLPGLGADSGRTTDPVAPADVIILLSTFNGARFLPEQLASIAGQTCRRWRLLWRDDGSTDGTVGLLDEFAAAYPAGAVVRAAGSGVHLGIFDSFLSLVKQAGDARVVALADQDDVWLPRKLQRAIDALAAVEPGRPALYCTGLTIVDAALTPVGVSQKLRHAPGFPGALLQNIASGCTMVLNRAAADGFAAAARPYNAVHDWWIYVLVTAIGGRIIFDETPSMLYRQHGTNLIGASWSRSFPRRVMNAIRHGSGAYNAMLQQHLDALDRNQAMLTPDAATGVRRIKAGFEGPWWRRIGLLLIPGFRRQSPIQTMVLALWLLRGTRPWLRRFKPARTG